MEELFPPNFRLVFTLDFEAESNWKCRMESGVESYHVDMVHQGTFGVAPPAEDVIHEMEPRLEHLLRHRDRGPLENRGHDGPLHAQAGGTGTGPDLPQLFSVSAHHVLPKFGCFARPNWCCRSRRPVRVFSTRSFATRTPNPGGLVWPGGCSPNGASGFSQRSLKKTPTRWNGCRKASTRPCIRRRAWFRRGKERCYHFQQYVKDETMPTTPGAGAGGLGQHPHKPVENQQAR